MAFSPDCAGRPDPSPDDGYPGCLLATSHVEFDMAGMFDIPRPQLVAESDRTERFWTVELGHAAPVFDFFDPSGGQKRDLEQRTDFKARDIPGIELVGKDLISTCGHDWYNVARTDYPSHCWVTLGPDGKVTGAIGAYNLGPKRDPKEVFHADKTSHYIGIVGQQFADQYLGAQGAKWCFSGKQRRAAGAAGQSQGPTIYAHQCSRPSEEPPGWLDATLILAYRPKFPLSIERSDFPEYSPINECYDGVWVEQEDVRGVLFACRQGGPVWWYGFPDPWREPDSRRSLINHRNLCFWNRGDPKTADGSPCMKDFLAYGPPITCYERDSEGGECTRGLSDGCNSSKGFHAIFEEGPASRGRLLWYPEEGLVEAVRGQRRVWEVPFEVLSDQPAEMWPSCKGAFGGLAWDPERRRLYVAQIHRGEFPVIHVYRIERGETGPAAR